jgi:hypothetical protein
MRLTIYNIVQFDTPWLSNGKLMIDADISVKLGAINTNTHKFRYSGSGPGREGRGKRFRNY